MENKTWSILRQSTPKTAVFRKSMYADSGEYSLKQPIFAHRMKAKNSVKLSGKVPNMHDLARICGNRPKLTQRTAIMLNRPEI